MYIQKYKILFLVVFTLITMMVTPVWAGDASQYNKSTGASQQDPDVAKEVLITNVSIFNGTSENLITGKDVVLRGNKIAKIVPVGSAGEGYAKVIDGKGGYLTPGLIDVHIHATAGVTGQEFFSAPAEYIQLFAGMEMGEMLMRGVTTVRDTGGNVFGLKMAIDRGHIPGPRIYGSGYLLSQTSGHADFRPQNNYMSNRPRSMGGGPSPSEEFGFAMMADGVDEVMKAVRQNLFLGASQIKIATAGGVNSLMDPIYVIEYTDEEIAAAVKVAADYGTYVMAHSHAAPGVIRAVNNGVKSIEHGSILDEKAAKLMAKKNVVYVPSVEVLEQLKSVTADNPIRAAKLKQAAEGTANSLKLAKKHGLLIGIGTDLLLDYEGRKLQLNELKVRKPYFSSPEIMIQATGNGGKIVGLSGKRNPYGKVGVIEEDAMADVLIYSKNPLEDAAIVTDYENNLKLIIKDGKVHKNTL